MEKGKDGMTLYTISPSSLTFDWDGCKRCFYIKQKYNLYVSGPFPGIFTRMGNLTSTFYQGKPSSEISPTLPEGMVFLREKWVKSQPIAFSGTDSQMMLKGRFDAVLAFADGSYGVIDYKTSDASEEESSFYSRQLSAYAYALENPAEGALSLTPITRLGLFILTPEKFERLPDGPVAFITRTKWMDIPRDDAAFLSLLRDVVTLLDQPEPPSPDEDCGLCNYRRGYKEAGILE
jgi:hypothetical protein